MLRIFPVFFKPSFVRGSSYSSFFLISSQFTLQSIWTYKGTPTTSTRQSKQNHAPSVAVTSVAATKWKHQSSEYRRNMGECLTDTHVYREAANATSTLVAASPLALYESRSQNIVEIHLILPEVKLLQSSEICPSPSFTMGASHELSPWSWCAVCHVLNRSQQPKLNV